MTTATRAIRPGSTTTWALLLAAAHTLAHVPAGRAQVVAHDVSSSFPPGPYSCLYVDALDPRRAAIGTSSGLVAWTEDAARTAHDARVVSPRRFDPMALRGASSSRRDLASASPTRRATRLFMRALREGLPWARWSFWMALENAITDIVAVAMPHGSGRMIAGAPGGVLLSDRSGHAWTRTFGRLAPMPDEDEPTVYAVTVDPAAPSRMLAGASTGLVVSEDGGFTFRPHPDRRLDEQVVTDFLWDAADPNTVLAVTPGAVLLSSDGGRTLEVAFGTPATVTGVAFRDGGGAYIATSEGLVVVDGSGEELRLLPRQSLVGVARWGEGALVATQTDLFVVSEAGTSRTVARTTALEPFLALRGASPHAWAITERVVYRIDEQALRRVDAGDPPRLLLSMTEVEDAVREHLLIGPPGSTRFHDRWYAKLIPRLVIDVFGSRVEGVDLSNDATLPLDYRTARSSGRSTLDFQVVAMWDLSRILVGHNHAANPDLFIESNLRETQDQILREVRRRYREVATLTRRLERPPADVVEHVAWRNRLEEHAAYLEALAGREVVRGEGP